MYPNTVKIASNLLICRVRQALSKGQNRHYLMAHYLYKGGRLVGNKSKLASIRLYATDPSLVKPKKTSYGFKGTIILLGLGTGAVVAYAKHDPEFREIVKDYSPGFDNFIKVVTQEDKSYLDSAGEYFNQIQDWVSQQTGIGAPEPAKQKLPSTTPTPISPPKYEASSKKETPTAVKERPVALPPQPPMTDKHKPASTDPPTTKSDTAKSLADVERLVFSSAATAIDSYNTAIAALRDHREDVYKVLDRSVDQVTPALWNSIKVKSDVSQKLLTEAEQAARDALKQVKSLESLVQSDSTADNVKSAVKNNIDRITRDLDKAKKQLEVERDAVNIADRYWKKVADARTHFKDELEVLFPYVNIDAKKLNLKEADFDLFLLHAYQHVMHYQKELAKLEVLGEQRIKQALQTQGDQISDALLEARVQQELDRERRVLVGDLQKKLLSVKAEQERETRQQLKRQIEAHSDHLADVLQAKEQEVQRKVQRELDERVDDERKQYKLKLASMVGKLQGLEQALKARAEADKNAHHAHTLFSACQALYRALRYSKPGVPYSQQLRPLELELKAINGASGNDALVTVVLRSVPPEAVQRGVYPEDVLRERFLKVERVAKKLALVPENGGSLPMYLLSYIQSFLLFKSVNPITTAELEDKPVDHSQLDTYDILQRARYWLDRGDFSMTLRYMNLLKGAPRQVAGDWIRETRVMLETQQAANTLMAHAAATGLMFLG